MALIEIADYDPTWPIQFDSLAAAIRRVIGAAAERIDHIGSTSMAGLPAKDVIDIQISVVTLEDNAVIEPLVAAGFQHRPNIVNDSLVGFDARSPELAKQFLRGPVDHRAANIHVRELGRINQRYPLVFRDYLCSDDVTRGAYAAIKRQLALRFPDDEDAYYDTKIPT